MKRMNSTAQIPPPTFIPTIILVEIPSSRGKAVVCVHPGTCTQPGTCEKTVACGELVTCG